MKDLILIIDDEIDLLDLLEIRLSNAGFDVIGCLNTKNAEKILEEESVSLMIVDRNLEYENGIREEGSKFVKKIRKNGVNIPIIFLSALNSKEDQMKGFERGGDDYITKPFDFDLLLAKINALLRRQKGSENKNYIYKNLHLDINTRILNIDDKNIFLTPLEAKILHIFFLNPRKVLTKDFLLESIWDNQNQIKSINVAIKRLRQKLNDDKNKYIKNIRSEGYMLV
ncbi:hypothetical protein CCY99_08240 [Helicobacter sp. 16-1353]|uniref:response regulator transcription factor n=1 Tax=Helicobacter sp. 16-1353 TaxID=2004996 RepID=UPI000DCEF865|nr:response regulator transcription factor [Helicobacter sp. 16-1353]RAX51930.1 hypothetical protein CCY99_08240 [Helicobacter sp. 16-1353]